MSVPPVSRIRRLDTHRLIPSAYSEGSDTVFAGIAEDDEHLSAIVELDRATDERAAAEHDRLPGIGIDELIFGVPHARIVNAAFCHAHPLGSRFNGPERGAWYAGFEPETAQAEIAWHKTVELLEVGWLEESLVYDDYLADFGGAYHDIRGDATFGSCLDPGSYLDSQALAETLLERGSPGIVYPSVRREGGACLACFRPALVGNVRRHARYRFTWAGSPRPDIALEDRS